MSKNLDTPHPDASERSRHQPCRSAIPPSTGPPSPAPPRPISARHVPQQDAPTSASRCDVAYGEPTDLPPTNREQSVPTDPIPETAIPVSHEKLGPRLPTPPEQFADAPDGNRLTCVSRHHHNDPVGYFRIVSPLNSLPPSNPSSMSLLDTTKTRSSRSRVVGPTPSARWGQLHWHTQTSPTRCTRPP